MSKRRSRARNGNPKPSIKPGERTPKATAGVERKPQDEPDPHWEISKVAGSHELKVAHMGRLLPDRIRYKQTEPTEPEKVSGSLSRDRGLRTR